MAEDINNIQTLQRLLFPNGAKTVPTSKELLSNLKDGSLTATVIEYERFQLKQIEFWQLYEKHGKEVLLISYEDFLEQPNLIIKKINNKYENLYQSEKRNLTQTVSLGILYRNKFKNFNEIKGWFNE